MKKWPHPLHCFQHKEDRGTMKTVPEIIGGAQTLLPLDYEIQDCFPELLSCEHRSFLHHLRVREHLPQGFFIHRQKTGRPYGGDRKYFRAFLAKAFLGLESTKKLIGRLRADVNLRYLCGFVGKSGLSEATFSTRFALLAKSELLQKEAAWGGKKNSSGNTYYLEGR